MKSVKYPWKVLQYFSDFLFCVEVCGVQPGRALELRTNLGLMRAKQMLQQQQLVESVAEPIPRATTVVNKAQLKTAR